MNSSVGHIDFANNIYRADCTLVRISNPSSGSDPLPPAHELASDTARSGVVAPLALNAWRLRSVSKSGPVNRYLHAVQFCSRDGMSDRSFPPSPPLFATARGGSRPAWLSVGPDHPEIQATTQQSIVHDAAAFCACERRALAASRCDGLYPCRAQLPTGSPGAASAHDQSPAFFLGSSPATSPPRAVKGLLLPITRDPLPRGTLVNDRIAPRSGRFSSSASVLVSTRATS